MAAEDIYKNKARYERFLRDLELLTTPPEERPRARGGIGKYACRNAANLRHFRALAAIFDARDLSYIRRHRVMSLMRFVCDATTQPLERCDRDEIDRIVGAAHRVYRTPKSKETFLTDLRYVWRLLFPERDERGRADDTLVPYAVRHVRTKTDKSREERRRDKLSWEEFERLVAYFGRDARLQAFLTLSLESLARPQELLYVRLGSVELQEHFAKIWISDHGKEGVGLLQCIDSYPYLLKWLDVHPLRSDKNAFLFVNTGDKNRCGQLHPRNVNKMIQQACRDLGIKKPITCYSLKRNGVTMRRLRGETDMDIQHAARWTSTAQLKTYDLSSQDDAFKRALQKRGLIPNDGTVKPDAKRCAFCTTLAGFSDHVCRQCKRPLDQHVLRAETQRGTREVETLREEVAKLTSLVHEMKPHVLAHLGHEIRERHAVTGGVGLAPDMLSGGVQPAPPVRSRAP